MANSIRLKKSGVAGKVPLQVDLSISELSYNYADGMLYGKRTFGGLETILEFASSENPFLLKHAGTVSVPASGYLRFYPKSDNCFYKKDASGNEFKFWDSQNHGPGSGLNADFLDGQHASAFQGYITLNERRLVGRIEGEGLGGVQEIRLGDSFEFDENGVLQVNISGGVTSVGLSMPNIFSVSGSPVTGAGTLAASFVSQTKNRVFAAPASANGIPVFRQLVAEDIPDLSAQYDYYYSWNMKVNSGSTYQILKTGSSVYSGAYNGINMIAGNGIEISESSVAGGAFGITIASLVAHNDSSTVTYASSTAVATGGTFTAISNRPLPTPGTYLVLVQIMCSFTSAANNVQAKIFNGSNVYASTRLDSALNDTTNKITTFYAIVQTSVNNHYVYLSATASVSGASVISNTGISSNGTVMSYIKLT